MYRGGDEACVKERLWPDRRGAEQIEITGKEESRKRRYQVAEQQHGQKNQQDNKHELKRQGGAEFKDGFKVAQHAPDQQKCSDPKGERQRRERQTAAPGRAGAKKTIFPGEPE